MFLIAQDKNNDQPNYGSDSLGICICTMGELISVSRTPKWHVLYITCTKKIYTLSRIMSSCYQEFGLKQLE